MKLASVFLILACLCAVTLAHWPSFNIDTVVSGGIIDSSKTNQVYTIGFTFTHTGKDNARLQSNSNQLLMKFPECPATVLSDITDCQHYNEETKAYEPWAITTSNVGVDSPSVQLNFGQSYWTGLTMKFQCKFTIVKPDWTACSKMVINVEYLNAEGQPSGHGFWPAARDSTQNSSAADKEYNHIDALSSLTRTTFTVDESLPTQASSSVAATVAVALAVVVALFF